MASITKRNGSYYFRVSGGYTAEGKQIYHTKTWKIPNGMSDKKAEKEAQKQATLFEQAIKQGTYIDSTIKFSAFAEQWFSNYAEVQLRKTTVERYKELMKRIEPAFGQLRMDQITPQHLMKFYKDLSEAVIKVKSCSKIDFKAFLKNKKITMAKLSSDSNVSITTVRTACNGGNIERENALKICETLGVKYASIFDDIGGTHFAPKTMQHYHRLLSSMFEKAVKWQIIAANPCDRVDAPKVDREEGLFLDQEQAVKLLEYLQYEPTNYRCAAEVLLYTGMRRGELLGLKWDDIYFDSKLIDINKTSLYLPGVGIFEDKTKNRSSKRVIKVTSTVILALRNMQAWQAQQQDALGDAWQDSGYVFTSLNGSPMHPDILTSWFHDFIAKTDLPQIHLHSLRHTCATLMIAHNKAITTVAGQLGHANAATTEKIYAHSIAAAQAEAAEDMEDMLKHKTIPESSKIVKIG